MKKQNLRNLEHNRQLPVPPTIPSGMIDQQHTTGDYLFGRVWQKPHHRKLSIQRLTRIPEGERRQMGSSFNGCGWIAAYNALQLLGRPLPPWEIIDALEPGVVLRGYLGLSPFALRRFFKRLGFSAKLWFLPMFLSPAQNARSIEKRFADVPCAIFYVATRNRTVHYVCAENLGDGTCHFYNDDHISCETPDRMENFVRRQAAVLMMLTIR